MRRVGILGGTFDPPHLGHLLVAQQVRSQLDLHEVWLMVANDPWQKRDSRAVTAASDRLAMTELAVSWANDQLQSPNALVASAVELELGGPSYMMVTLEHLTATAPDVDWVVIVGSDTAAGLDTWHRAADLRSQAKFAVVQRPGSTQAEAPPVGFDCEFVEMPALDVSSSELRRLFASGRDVHLLTPPGVIDLAVSRNIYRPES